MEHTSSNQTKVKNNLFSRKFNTEFRKKLVSRFDKLKNKNDYLEIYNIITNDIGNNFSSNRNGIFININLLSDSCIEKLIDYLEDKLNLTVTQTESEKINYKSYNIDEIQKISEIGHKLSYQEKTIIKRIRKVNN